ncbi:zinc finger protein 878 [Teleopsis dalmanni]|uniref:zinc finger protein 878 n=1 Tax=Teleopsis dalmanni TaxID=139649 RepID=UPI0018CE201B|nr:zinc finger protein 878 [Teleopsis dalmanni]
METCRTCAKCDFEDDKSWFDLFHPTCWEEEIGNIRMEISYWKLKISQNDGLPQKICVDCFSKFCTVYTFHAECQEAQLKLNNIFDKIDAQSLEEDSIDNLSHNKFMELTNIYDETSDIIEEEHSNSAYSLNTATNLVDEIVEQAENSNILQMEVSNVAKATTSAIVTYTAVNKNSNEIVEIPPKSPPPTTTTTTTGPLVEQQLAEVDILSYNQINEDSIIDQLVEDMIEEIEPESETHITNTELETANGPDKNEIVYTFECKFCYKCRAENSRNFSTQQELLAHITAMHNTEYPFNCPHCEQGFQDAASRTVHIKNQHIEKHFNCDVCGKKYADRFNLRHHIEKYHSDTDFECLICEKRFYSRKSLNYHMKWHNPARQFKCSHCDRLFINQRHLKCHEETHTGVRNSEHCTFCGKSFIHLKTLRWHIYRKHGGDKPYKCGNCTEAFDSYIEKRLHMLDLHLENLTSIERTECMLCHIRYENEIDLKEHMLEEHKQARKLTNNNNNTLIIANNKRILQNKKQKNYNGLLQCQVCSQRFNMKSALERHLAVHSTEGRPYACPQCSKRFKRAQDMNWHMKTHSNEKPNICDVCGKGFALKYVLNQHKKSHEVLEKNFTCITCGRSYLFEKSLRLHERSHSQQNYYKCGLCSESFGTHIKLTCHMRKTHDTINNNRELPLDELINIVIS